MDKTKWLVLVIVGIVAISTNELIIADSWIVSKVIQFILCISVGIIAAYLLENTKRKK